MVLLYFYANFDRQAGGEGVWLAGPPATATD
jgi:hypothetical protein